MKAKSTIQREIRALRKYAETDGDPIGARVAWCVEHALRWVAEDVKGGPNRVVAVQATANLIRRDLEQEGP